MLVQYDAPWHAQPRLRDTDNEHMGALLRSSTYRARAKRRDMTPAERTLWALLRNRALGFKFRRQQPIGPFYADFYCREAALVVEVDGPYHQARRRFDRQRDSLMTLAGLRLLRLTNKEVLNDPQRAVRRIRQCLAEAFDLRTPSPACGRGGRG